MNFFKKIEDEVVYKKLSRGRETGPISRILSGICLFTLVYLLVNLFKNEKYLPFIILLILGFTPLGFWILVGLLIFFIITKYWFGVILILLYGVLSQLSGYFGEKNIKRILNSKRSNVDPFEGHFEMSYIFILQFIFFGLAFLTSGIFSIILWVLFTFVILYEVYIFYFRLSSPWRRLHFSLMMRYATIAGRQMGLAKSTGKEFSIREALGILVKSAYPHIDDTEINLLIKSAKEKMVKFDDKEALEKLIQKNNTAMDKNKLREVVDKLEDMLKDPEKEKKGLYIRYVIAEIVGRDYGEKERLNYINAVILGQAI